MFEIGIQLRKERGAENVFDFSIGNPDVEPPGAVITALRSVVAENRPRSHGYMPNAGFPEVRATIARRLAERSGIPFTADDILMTTGAAGAINIVLKSILDPGDEVILLNPYFPEYRFYVENHGGRVVCVETDANFRPDISNIAAAITRRTKALILNSPNNQVGLTGSAANRFGRNRIANFRSLSGPAAATPATVNIVLPTSPDTTRLAINGISRIMMDSRMLDSEMSSI